MVATLEPGLAWMEMSTRVDGGVRSGKKRRRGRRRLPPGLASLQWTWRARGSVGEEEKTGAVAAAIIGGPGEREFRERVMCADAG